MLFFDHGDQIAISRRDKPGASAQCSSLWQGAEAHPK